MARNPIPILLVEDYDIDVEIVRRLLKRVEISNPLHVARDGVEALSLLDADGGNGTVSQPCIILVDINMPRMNGFELLGKLRSDDSLRRNVVIFLTTSSRQDDIAKAYDLNAAGYVLKEHTAALAGLLKDYCSINEFPAA